MPQQQYRHEPTPTVAKINFRRAIAFVLGMLTCGLAVTARAAQVSNSVSVQVEQADNLGSSFSAADEISDASLQASYQRNYRKSLGLSGSLFYGLSLSAREYLDYPRSRANFSARVGVDKKLGVGFYKPRLTLAWRGSRIFYQSSDQNTLNSRLSVSASRPLSETVNIALELGHEWQIPDNNLNELEFDDSDDLPASALDRRWTEITLSSEVFLDSYWSLPISVSNIRGDLESLSSALQPALVRAEAITRQPSLGSTPYLYRYDGRAWTARVGASRLLENNSRLDLGIDYSSVRATRGGSYSRSSLSLAWAKSW